MPYKPADTKKRLVEGVVEMCEADHAQPPPRHPQDGNGLVWAHTELYLESTASYGIGAGYIFICVHCQRRWVSSSPLFEKSGELCITSLEWE